MTRLKPFHEGIWYAVRDTVFEEYKVPYSSQRKDPYLRGCVIVVLRCAGYMTGMCSYYDIVDDRGQKRHILVRVGRPFDWEPG